MAVIVMRYMNGDELSEADKYRAKAAIKKADNPEDPEPDFSEFDAEED